MISQTQAGDSPSSSHQQRWTHYVDLGREQVADLEAALYHLGIPEGYPETDDVDGGRALDWLCWRAWHNTVANTAEMLNNGTCGRVLRATIEKARYAFDAMNGFILRSELGACRTHVTNLAFVAVGVILLWLLALTVSMRGYLTAANSAITSCLDRLDIGECLTKLTDNFLKFVR